MNIQRFILATIAVGIFIFAYDFVVHGMLLQATYTETPQLWRTEADMQANFHWVIAAEVAVAAALTWLFAQHYEGKGLGEGVRFGLYVGVLMGVAQASAYNYMPISMKLAGLWFAATVVCMVGAGVVLSFTYKK